MRAMVAELQAKRAEAAFGGNERARERHVGRGKLLPRDRVMNLIDPGSPFLELSPLAANKMYDDTIHGAGLITISLAYYTFLAKSGSCDRRLIEMAEALGKTGADKPTDFVVALQELQKACGVDNLKMSDYDIQKDEINKIAENAYATMGGLYQVDPCTIAIEDTIKILEESYR
jgi:hypothetical protein